MRNHDNYIRKNFWGFVKNVLEGDPLYFFHFSFKTYLKLVFTIVDRKNTNSHQPFTRKIYLMQKKE